MAAVGECIPTGKEEEELSLPPLAGSFPNLNISLVCREKQAFPMACMKSLPVSKKHTKLHPASHRIMQNARYKLTVGAGQERESSQSTDYKLPGTVWRADGTRHTPQLKAIAQGNVTHPGPVPASSR